SEDCPVTGHVFSVGGGRVARIFIAEGPGFFKKDLSLEDVRDNWDDVMAEEGYAVPTSANDEIGTLVMPNLAES
ncbi:MAG: hypothetical protein ACRDYV_05080, partial [Acidimicrobiia bacterium]